MALFALKKAKYMRMLCQWQEELSLLDQWEQNLCFMTYKVMELKFK